MDFIIYLMSGAFAGFIAGLFGIGGGLIVVPILCIVFTQLNYDPAIVMHMAIGTSLSTMIITSTSSVLTHHHHGNVMWPVFRYLSIGMIVGSLSGAAIANLLPSHALQLIIGLFALWIAYQMFQDAKVEVDTSRHLPRAPLQVLTGGGIGFASAIFGIGGGSFTVPYLTHHGVVMQKAVGTSAACGLIISIVATIGFIWFGSQKSIAIAGAIGYVNIYAFIGISMMSFITAGFGAKAANKLPAGILKKYFSVLMLVVASYFFYQFYRH
ncbi:MULTISPECIES: sulfite exporter TauE/SafE family protein [unclassified Acinetobacter]|uniref:sulfite exporter TauE/SafE family protein n=1 Tax=unclassified Acinetobacter TaxID=196816 RepID=UPI002934378E|nr:MULTISPECIES: sulfite exporter TauE/SafE family protein [unclassified Acinetobacter]WOE30867.1 sulfite exporter TauE/SafE family protein [Acinetobacter sp. SAAs470]WOE39062.1 sulfite exporter TauE/SafE family protein [Acinetobacter sp. SAAs474]